MTGIALIPSVPMVFAPTPTTITSATMTGIAPMNHIVMNTVDYAWNPKAARPMKTVVPMNIAIPVMSVLPNPPVNAPTIRNAASVPIVMTAVA